LDDVLGLEKFIVEPPKIDWTFGGAFKEDTAMSNCESTTNAVTEDVGHSPGRAGG
jgi:hypothetical protein